MVGKQLSGLQAKLAKPFDGSPHLIIRARAGTGKTTVLIEGLKLLKGLPTTIDPSPQQRAIWDALLESKDKAKSVCFVAFNKSIAEELQRRVPEGCEAMTMHSLGYRSILRSYPGTALAEYRVQKYTAERLGVDLRQLKIHKKPLLKGVEELVGLCKLNMLGGSKPVTYDQLAMLAETYDIQLEEYRNQVFDLVPEILERCKDIERDRMVDNNDMIWLPQVLNLVITKYDILLYDEYQDSNKCQQSLARRVGTRLILCGDDCQSIYGFMGATGDFDRTKAELGATPVGCQLLPLTMTRRCGKSIVAQAKQLVPDFEAHESNPRGLVKFSKIDLYRKLVQPGDMVICRLNAPLLKQRIKFIMEGKKAHIVGRKDVGKRMIEFIEGRRAVTVLDLISKMAAWLKNVTSKELAKPEPDENKIDGYQDLYECALCFTANADTVDDVIRLAEEAFADPEDNRPGISLSSIHKAKGLEAKRVFILCHKEAAFRKAKLVWQEKEQRNLKYVAITRAIEELCYVQ